MSKILITGVNGFVGHHLAREAKNQGFEVIGTSLNEKLDATLIGVVDTFIGRCDLTKSEDVRRVPLKDVQAIVNLAGLAQVGTSFGKEDLYNTINVQVHTVLAGELLKIKSAARVIAVSTGAVYDSPQPMPLKETSKLLSVGSPYALSKIAMEKALDKFRVDGLDTVITRPFNHIGPGQLPGFLVPDLASQINATGRALVGNLKTSRDYTDVRDVAKAYMLLATKLRLSHYIYNVCSGKTLTGEVILETIKKYMGGQPVIVEVDPKFIRPNDPERIVGDNSRLVEETGWSPTIPLEQTIADYLAGLAS